MKMTGFSLVKLVTLAMWISLVTSKEKREAQTQNCVGSQCGQNNLNLSPFTAGHGLQAFQGFGPFGGFNLGLGGPVGHGGFGGGFGSGQVGGFVGQQQQQNCVGSQCQQNNQNLGVGTALGGGFVGGQAGGLVVGQQNCVGSQCQQNNQNLGGGGGSSLLLTSQAQNCLGSQCQQNNQNLGGSSSLLLSSQSQNCVGSQCQQNNQNLGGGGGPALVLTSQAQNCLGSQCQQTNQNALGRKKRSTEGDINVSVDKRRNLTIRKISNEEGEERKKRSAAASSRGFGGMRRKYTRRVVRTEPILSYEEGNGDVDSQSDFVNRLTSESFLNKVVSFRYLDDDTH